MRAPPPTAHRETGVSRLHTHRVAPRSRFAGILCGWPALSSPGPHEERSLHGRQRRCYAATSQTIPTASVASPMRYMRETHRGTISPVGAFASIPARNAPCCTRKAVAKPIESTTATNSITAPTTTSISGLTGGNPRRPERRGQGPNRGGDAPGPNHERESVGSRGGAASNRRS